MSELIDELRKEHDDILKALKTIEKRGLAGKEVGKEIEAIRTALIDHMKKEDELIYPALKEIAANRKELKRLLESSGEDMKDITDYAMEFLNTYPHGGTGDIFKRDLKHLVSILRNRILNEENFFFLEYEILYG